MFLIDNKLFLIVQEKMFVDPSKALKFVDQDIGGGCHHFLWHCVEETNARLFAGHECVNDR